MNLEFLAPHGVVLPVHPFQLCTMLVRGASMSSMRYIVSLGRTASNIFETYLRFPVISTTKLKVPVFVVLIICTC